MSSTQPLGQDVSTGNVTDAPPATPEGGGPPETLPDVVPDVAHEVTGTLSDAVDDAREGLGDIVTDTLANGIDAVGLAMVTETTELIANVPI